MDTKEASPSPPPPPLTTISIDENTIDTNADSKSEPKIESEFKIESDQFPEPENETTEKPQIDASQDLNSPESDADEEEEDDDEEEEDDDEEEEDEEPSSKKQKHLTEEPPKPEPEMSETPSPADAITPLPLNGKPPISKSSKKSKKKSKDVWSTTTRKAKKKTKHAFSSKSNTTTNPPPEDKMLMINSIPRFVDKTDDSPELTIRLSKSHKAEKIELSDDRLTAGSTKGYRMVRATRGVTDGAWYFEIKVVHLGESGHTRLGLSTEKGDLQAPVGFDVNSFGYRDVDGSKVHKALRQEYGKEGYGEGDVVGVYISLPDGASYAPEPPKMVWHKGQRFVCAPGEKEEEKKVVPGSEISFFKNGISQGVAFTDLYGGRYYPAASMYTLPNQPNCVVKFNFGPDFEKFPADFGQRPAPRPMVEVPYQDFDGRLENGGIPWKMTRMPPMLKVVKDDDITIAEDAETVD